MVKATSILGFDYFYRATPDGRIQRSDDAIKWSIPGNWRGKRVDMTKTTVAQAEQAICRQLAGNGDLNLGAVVI